MAKKENESIKSVPEQPAGEIRGSFFNPENILITAFVAAAGIVLSLLLTVVLPVSFVNGGSRIIYITYGSGFKKISRELDDSKLLRNRVVFDLFVIAAGSSKRLQAGEYEFNMHDSMNTIAAKMEKGDVVQHKIVVPEGSDIYDIAGILSAGGMADRTSFLALVRNRDFLKSIGIDRDSAEGLLFPDTYYLLGAKAKKRSLKPCTRGSTKSP